MEKVLPFFWKVLKKDESFQPDWEKICKHIDKLQTGQLQSRQFTAAAADRLNFLRNNNDLQWAFNVLDKNSDGYISLNEFKSSFGFQSKNLRVSTRVQEKAWEEFDAEF